MDAPPPPRRGAKLLANLKRLLLLLVLLVGVLGGHQLWQTSFATKTFTLSVEVEQDVTGEGNRSGVRTAELLEMSELVATVPGADGPLAVQPLAESARTTFETVGRTERDEVEQGRLTAFLRLPEADPDRPTLELPPPAVDGDHLRFTLTHDAADEFLSRRVETVVAVRNQHGTPVTGLTDRLGELEEEGKGVYHVRARLDDVLWNLLDGNRTASLQATADGITFQVALLASRACLSQRIWSTPRNAVSGPATGWRLAPLSPR